MNTEVFAHYSRYYDLLYRDKDYAGEARLVDGWLRTAGLSGGSLLDLGCGSGMHAREFARLGWAVTGVDLSPAMIAIARAKTAPASAIEFIASPAEDVSLDRTVSAIVSLFHVTSYQSTPDAVAKLFANVRRHLAPGGLFIFDFWHGPGVLADPPALRVRRVEDDCIKVTRISEPRHFPAKRLIDVHYEVYIEDVLSRRIERVCETHCMRYFSVPELEPLLVRAGFRIECTRAGLAAESLHDRAWYGLIEARAV